MITVSAVSETATEPSACATATMVAIAPCPSPTHFAATNRAAPLSSGGDEFAG